MSDQPHLFVPHAPTPASEHDFYTFDLEAKDTEYSPVDTHKNDQISFDQNVFNPLFEASGTAQPFFPSQPPAPPFYPDNSAQQPQAHTLSHASSYSSLTSSSASDMGSGHGLWVTTDESPYDSPLPHSRNSSFSFTPNAPLDTFPPAQWSMPTFPVGQPISLDTIKQPLSIETKLGRTSVDRLKGSYRSQPYSRQRSESVSLKSEADDDVSALLSASTNQSVVTPWTQTPWQNPLVQGVDRMTLHHRRTSSAASNLSHLHQVSPRRPMLSRSHRSSTLSGVKRPPSDLFPRQQEITGTAEERENTVRKLLHDGAGAILSLSTLTAQDKARGAWVKQWLHLCYTREEGSTVPRQGLYHSYTLSCQDYGMRPINSASFGKAVRGAYQGIKTRRLGHRGNSKYHYVCLRPAIRSEAKKLNEYGDSSGHWHVAPEDGSMAFRVSETAGEFDMVDDTDEDDEEEEGDDGNDTFDTVFAQGFPSQPFAQETPFDNASARPVGMMRRHTTTGVHFEGVKLDIPTPVFNLPGFPCLAEQPFIPGAPSAEAFWHSFCQHQEALANCVRNLQWDNFNGLCLSYWSSLSLDDAEVCQQLHINELVVRGMAKSYEHFISILLDRLFVNLSPDAQDATRRFAKNLQGTMEQAMGRFSPEISQPRVELATRAAHLFTRFLDLQQVTNALCPYLVDHRQLKLLLGSWDKLDVSNINDQIMLSCNCDEELVHTILGEFRQWLSATLTTSLSGDQAIRRLGDWIVRTLQGLKGREGSTGMSRSIIAKTCLFTSQVLRDFTLKSDTTFGIFQLVKTWIDDWSSIVVLRESALSIDTLEMRRMPSEMRVMIPSQSAETQPMDITTAVPIQHGLLPAFGQEHMVVNTPKPFSVPQPVSL